MIKRFFLSCMLFASATVCVAMQHDLQQIRDYVRKPIQESEILTPVANLIDYLLKDQNTKLYAFIKAKYTEDKDFKQPFKNISYEDLLCNMVFDERFCDGIFQKYLQQSNLCALLLVYLYYEIFVFRDILSTHDDLSRYLLEKKCRGYSRFTEREMIQNVLDKLDALVWRDCMNSDLEESSWQCIIDFKDQLITLWVNFFDDRSALLLRNDIRSCEYKSPCPYADLCNASWICHVVGEYKKFEQVFPSDSLQNISNILETRTFFLA